MIDFQDIFSRLTTGCIILSMQSEDFYINASAASLLGLENAEASQVKEKLAAFTNISLEDIQALAVRDKRNTFSFHSSPMLDEKEKNLPHLLTINYLLDRKDTGELTRIIIFLSRSEPLIHDLEMKEKLMAMAVHDIKTPFSSVKESSSLVWDETVGELNDMQKKCMDIAQKELVRLYRILENIIRIGKFDAHSLSENFRSADLEHIFSDLEQQVKEKCSRKKIRLEKVVNKDSLPEVLASPELLGDALFYMLDYILEKADHSSEVQITSQQEDGFIKLTIHYEGVIPSQEERKTIFSDFWNDKATALIRKEHIDAFSLGICRTFISNIGGRIETAEKDTGKNEFTVILPVK